MKYFIISLGSAFHQLCCLKSTLIFINFYKLSEKQKKVFLERTVLFASKNSHSLFRLVLKLLTLDEHERSYVPADEKFVLGASLVVLAQCLLHTSKRFV